MEDDLIDELLPEEEGTTEEPQKKYASIAELISQSFAQPLYFFTVETPGPTKTARGTIEKLWSITEVMENTDFSEFISDETRAKYADIVANPNLDAQAKVVELITDVYDDISTGKKQYVVEAEGTFTQPGKDTIITFNEKQTTGATLSYKDFAEGVENTSTEEIVLAEEVEEASKTAQDIQAAQGAIRTSHPTWGYKTTKDGLIQNSTGEFVPAPFWKGNEYSMFSDMDPSEIFALQQKMVRAGMKAPTVEQYGQWSDTEANFMSAVFIKAADDTEFSWEKDTAAGLPAYTTALQELMDEVGQTEDFIKLLNEANYLQSEPNVSPAQIQQLLDQAAAGLGITLTAQNLVDYGNLAVQAYGQAAALEKDFQGSLITDRDVILGTTYKDIRAVGEGEFPRYLKGAAVPLVLPSYEYLMGQKGPQPVVKSALEIVTEALEARPEIQQQQAANEDLQDIKYSTNLFEASMGAIELGGN
jgi:hypothetical protein